MAKQYTLKEAISEIKREQYMRRYTVYPMLIAQGKLDKDEANKRYGRMQKALRELEKLFEHQNPKQGELKLE